MEEGEIKQINSNDCLVCYTQKGEVKLCEKCKYLYCQECSVRLNHRCSICLRNTENQSTTHLNPLRRLEFPMNYIPFRYSVTPPEMETLVDRYVYPATDDEWQNFFGTNWGFYGWNWSEVSGNEEIPNSQVRSNYSDSSGNENIRIFFQEDTEEYDFDQLSRMYYWW
jgi:hypothetical protein